VEYGIIKPVEGSDIRAASVEDVRTGIDGAVSTSLSPLKSIDGSNANSANLETLIPGESAKSVSINDVKSRAPPANIASGLVGDDKEGSNT
jgi:hypothetical protein